MMTLHELSGKWSKLPDKANTEGFKSLLLSPELNANLFIGVDKHSKRCLILSLPGTFNIQADVVKKANLEIEYYLDSKLIVLRLMDRNYKDLFDDFILSVLNKLWSVTNPSHYTKALIQIFYRWVEFFEDNSESKLSDDEVKGLFGELNLLKSIIKDSDSCPVNQSLESWRGPFNHKNDFVLGDRNIEVKTKDTSSLDVKISSEHQLEAEHGKGLVLHVISVDLNILSGHSLRSLIEEVKWLIQERSGDVSLLYKPLALKGITLGTINDYDHLRFTVREEASYNCLAEGFPRIIKSKTHPALSNIKYNLRVGTLNDYIISKKTY